MTLFVCGLHYVGQSSANPISNSESSESGVNASGSGANASGCRRGGRHWCILGGGGVLEGVENAQIPGCSCSECSSPPAPPGGAPGDRRGSPRESPSHKTSPSKASTTHLQAGSEAKLDEANRPRDVPSFEEGLAVRAATLHDQHLVRRIPAQPEENRKTGEQILETLHATEPQRTQNEQQTTNG